MTKLLFFFFFGRASSLNIFQAPYSMLSGFREEESPLRAYREQKQKFPVLLKVHPMIGTESLLLNSTGLSSDKAALIQLLIDKEGINGWWAFWRQDTI